MRIYAWKDVSQDPTKLVKLRVAELNKYLKHPRLEKYLTRHLLLQILKELICYKQDETKLKMNLCQTVITTIVMKTTTVEAKAAVMRRMKMIALTLVIETNRVMSFLHSSMTKKLRGQPQHVREEASRRSEIDFFLFSIFFNELRASWHISFLLTL